MDASEQLAAKVCRAYRGVGPTGVPAKWACRERPDGAKTIVDLGTSDARGVIAVAETWAGVVASVREWALHEVWRSLTLGQSITSTSALGELIKMVGA